MELTKKQIENILAWVGKSYPAEMKPSTGLPIEVLTKEFLVYKVVYDGLKYSIKNVVSKNTTVKVVIAWRYL